MSSDIYTSKSMDAQMARCEQVILARLVSILSNAWWRDDGFDVTCVAISEHFSRLGFGMIRCGWAQMGIGMKAVFKRGPLSLSAVNGTATVCEVEDWGAVLELSTKFAWFVWHILSAPVSAIFNFSPFPFESAPCFRCNLVLTIDCNWFMYSPSKY